MPGVVHPDSIASLLADFDSRLRRVESYRASGMQIVSQTPGLGYTVGTVTPAVTESTGARSPQFTLTRPTMLFVTPVIVLVVNNAGTGVSYEYAWPYIANLDGTQAGDINNQAMIATIMVTEARQYNVMDTCHPFCAIAPAGTYMASLFLACDAGSGSALGVLGQITVYSLGD